MYTSFNLLVKFVEIEKGHLEIENNKEKYLGPWWCRNWNRFQIKLHPEAGVNYLKSEIAWLDPMSVNDSMQLHAYTEIWEIYHWWRYIRPNRPNPSDLSELKAFRELHPNVFPSSHELSVDDSIKYRELMKLTRDISTQYDKEDDDMLIRLMKIRKNLWT
jgi:hypothetical protein